jgi:hypothetical protein
MENNINTQIEKLIAKTNDGKISWKTIGQNNFRWTKQDGTRLYTTTLQKQILPPNSINIISKENYILTIQSTNPNEIILQINTNSDITIAQSLKDLYNCVTLFTRGNSADIIDKLLGDL